MDILRFLAAILIVFGLLGALHFLSKRGGKSHRLLGFLKFSLGAAGSRTVQGAAANGDQLRILKRLNLSATHQVQLLQIDKETLLLCTHPQGCTVLRSSDDQASGNRLAEVQRRAS